MFRRDVEIYDKDGITRFAEKAVDCMKYNLKGLILNLQFTS